MKSKPARVGRRSRRAICVVSSLHPIEITSYLLLQRIRAPAAPSGLLLLYMNDRYKASARRNAFLSAHDALPIPLLVQDGDRIRQVFLPLSRDEPENLKVIDGLIAAYARLLPGPAGRRAALRLAGARLGDLGGESPLDIARSILNVLLEGWCVGPVRVQSYEDHVKRPASQKSVRRALTLLHDEMRHAIRGKAADIAFIRGGYIAARTSDTSVRLDRPRLTGSRLTVTAGESRWRLVLDHGAEAVVFDDRGKRREDVVLDLRGPLLMAYAHQLGQVIDAPWYLPQVRPAARVGVLRATEVISPVSAVCRDRVSAWSGGGGLRLHPSGYTLFDYPSPVTLRFVQAAAGLPHGTRFREFDDWRHLADNYPRSDQKIQKSQTALSQYLATRQREAHSQLRDGDTKALRELFHSGETRIPQLGAVALRMLALQGVLRGWARGTGESRPKRSQAYFLNRAAAEYGGAETALQEMQHRIARQMRAWRERVVLQNQPAWMEEGSFDLTKFLETLSSEMSTSAGGPASRLPPHQQLKDETLLYYKVVAALGTSLFKMHILNATLLFTPRQFEHLTDILVQRRSPYAHLLLTARLWTTVEKLSDADGP